MTAPAPPLSASAPGRLHPPRGDRGPRCSQPRAPPPPLKGNRGYKRPESPVLARRGALPSHDRRAANALGAPRNPVPAGAEPEAPGPRSEQGPPARPPLTLGRTARPASHPSKRPIFSDRGVPPPLGDGRVWGTGGLGCSGARSALWPRRLRFRARGHGSSERTSLVPRRGGGAGGLRPGATTPGGSCTPAPCRPSAVTRAHAPGRVRLPAAAVSPR